MKVYQHKVQYYETDKMGITHHSNYIRWMEEARVEYLARHGWHLQKLEAMGVEFNYDEYVARDKKNPDIIKAIYLKKEFSGFAVHLVQK